MKSSYGSLFSVIALTAVMTGFSGLLRAEQVKTASSVACYFVGRAYFNATGQGEVAGYFTDINGISGSLFNGSRSEANAFFTFRSDVFSLTPLPTNGDIGLDLVSSGTFSVYYNPSPNGDWSNPDTFSGGQLIAKFTRKESLFVQIGPASEHVLTEHLIASEDFVFNGNTHNFSRILPLGVTLNLAASNRGVPGVTGFPAGFPFAGNGFALAE